jgi:transcriptional regulator with XRE-family HTH domain
MINPEKIKLLVRKHFDEISPSQFQENLARFCPDLIDESRLSKQDEDKENIIMSQLVLFPTQPSPLSLNAYLACALSGLDEEQRLLMFHLSDIINVICKDYDIDLYEPRKKTDPVHHPEVADSEVFRTDRERVLKSDLLIHLSHYPSTGSGEELDFAYNALIPIIIISHSESKLSRMISGIPSFQINLNYTEPEELRFKLKECLQEIRPFLEQRKLAFSEYDANIVGNKIRILRESLGLTLNQAVQNTNLTVEILRQIEESSDKTSNPSLLQLREIATILKTTVADIVEPDLSERVISFLNDWITNKDAARYPQINTSDRNKVIRRILLRLIDSLED